MLSARHRGPSAVLALLVVAEVVALVALALTRLLAHGAGGATWVRAIIIVAGAGAFVLGARRQVMVDTRAFYLGLAAGAFMGALQ